MATGDELDGGSEDEFVGLADVAAELGVAPPVPSVARRNVTVPDGREVSAVAWGAPPPEVVFLHGGAQNARTWDGVATILRRPALAVDLAGHGHSSWRDDADYRPRTLAPDVATILRTGGDRPPVLVGMSLGGLVAIATAANDPDLISEVVVVDVTPGVGTKPSPNQSFVMGPDSFESPEEIVRRAIGHYPGRSAAGLRRGVLHNARRREDGRWVWRHHFGNLPTPPSRDHAEVWGDVGRLSMPVTLVLGGASAIVDEADLDRFLVLCPHARVRTVDGAGHSVQGSHPRELAAILADLPSLR